MANITGTYNGIALGDYISPVAARQNLSGSVRWNVNEKVLFRQHGRSTRYIGGGVIRFSVVFVKDVQDDPATDTILKQFNYFLGLRTTLRPLVGSKTGATLTLTDGTTTPTLTGVKILGYEILEMVKGLMYVRADFSVETE